MSTYDIIIISILLIVQGFFTGIGSGLGEKVIDKLTWWKHRKKPEQKAPLASPDDHPEGPDPGDPARWSGG